MVDTLFLMLSERNLLDNTYIMYSSDNGYHIGQHRLQPGKECGFEEDINVPLIIRGPGVPAGEVTDIVTSHTDIAPTIFSLIGKTPREDFDGAAIPVTANGLEVAKHARHEHVNVEYWGFALTEGEYGNQWYWNNTYKSLRILGAGYNLYYAVWCNNEHELYDLDVSPISVPSSQARPVPLTPPLLTERPISTPQPPPTRHRFPPPNYTSRTPHHQSPRASRLSPHGPEILQRNGLHQGMERDTSRWLR
jgi:Sulfatase